MYLHHTYAMSHDLNSESGDCYTSLCDVLQTLLSGLDIDTSATRETGPV